MQPFPPLPTDNLYKFIFISGVLIILFSFYTTYKQSSEVDAVTEQFYNVYKAMMEKNNALVLEADSLNLTANSKLDSLNIGTLIKDKHEFLKHQNSLDSLYINHKVRIAQSPNLSLSLLITGMLIALIGGIGWYRNTQVYQDRLLQLQVLLLEKELKQTSKPYRRHIEPNLMPRTYTRIL